MLNAILQSVILKWGFRRVLELGPVVSGGLSWWNALSPADRDNLLNILQGNWALVSIGGLVTLIGYVWSFISTVTPHATAHGVQVPVSQMTPVKKAEVKDAVAATVAKKRPNLVDAIFKR